MLDPTDGFKKSPLDEAVEDAIGDHCLKYGIDPLKAVKLFPVLARRQWLKRFLAHVELFKRTVDLPGDIAEIGVYRGLGLMTWANLLEAYCIGNRTKVVYGFDTWLGFEQLSPEDGAPDPGVGKAIGGFGRCNFLEELREAIAIFDADRFIPGKPRVTLVPGNIEHTVPLLVRDQPGIRFSLLHFDCDLYRPTATALHALWPLVVPGGILIFDEYAIKDWPGETKAVDDFFTGRRVKLRCFDWTNTPGAYVVKE